MKSTTLPYRKFELRRFSKGSEGVWLSSVTGTLPLLHQAQLTCNSTVPECERIGHRGNREWPFLPSAQAGPWALSAVEDKTAVVLAVDPDSFGLRMRHKSAGGRKRRGSYGYLSRASSAEKD